MQYLHRVGLQTACAFIDIGTCPSVTRVPDVTFTVVGAYGVRTGGHVVTFIDSRVALVYIWGVGWGRLWGICVLLNE